MRGGGGGGDGRGGTTSKQARPFPTMFLSCLHFQCSVSYSDRNWYIV